MQVEADLILKTRSCYFFILQQKIESNCSFIFQKHPSPYLLLDEKLDQRRMKAAMGLLNTHLV